MKKILFLMVAFLFFPWTSNAATLPRIKELTIEGEKIELNSNVFSYEAAMVRDGYKANIDVVVEDGLTYTIEGDTGIQVGANDIEITVTNEIKEQQIYFIKLIKKAQDSIVLSGNNRLESLTIQDVVFDFDPDKLEYHINVGVKRKLKIRYETESDSAVAYIDGNYALVDGSVITIKVTAQSGEVREYKLIVESDYVPTDEGIYTKETLDWKLILCFASAGFIALVLLIINMTGKKKKEH